MTPLPHPDPRTPFFNSIADAWDGWHDLPALEAKLAELFERFGVQPDEHVVDVGCGTGNLTLALLARLGSRGRVTALDISPSMLARAALKTTDTRVSWHEASADRLPLPDATCDRILCFSAWPHFDRPDNVVVEFNRALRPGGVAHILHLIAKEKVNRIHGAAHPSVHADRLPPVGEVAALFSANGFRVIETEDNASRYLLSARKEPAT
ncbi:MAG TPA: class I SAM-dependent methyltransferase [Kiritimatiellia bacterium]|nr:class I SAM-dependent methyltransferase [Kiritimatiellia bacterium]